MAPDRGHPRLPRILVADAGRNPNAVPNALPAGVLLRDTDLPTLIDRASMRDRDGRGKAATDRGRGRGWMGEPLAERKSLAPPTPLAEVVGLVLGSPEFQRR